MPLRRSLSLPRLPLLRGDGLGPIFLGHVASICNENFLRLHKCLRYALDAKLVHHG